MLRKENNWKRIITKNMIKQVQLSLFENLEASPLHHLPQLGDAIATKEYRIKQNQILSRCLLLEIIETLEEENILASSRFSISMICWICSAMLSCSWYIRIIMLRDICRIYKKQFYLMLTALPTASAARTSVSISTSISIIEDICKKNQL